MKICVLAIRALTVSLAVIFSAASNADQGLNDPPGLVANFQNYGDSSISDIRLRGSVHGIDYSISAAQNDNYIIFDISLNGRGAQLQLLKADFPEIDLRTIREGVSNELEPSTLRFDMEYGELGGCFSNSEARRLIISFNTEGRLSASRLTAAECRLIWRPLNLVQIAPATYSAVVQG